MPRSTIIFWVVVIGFIAWIYLGGAKRDDDGQLISEGSVDVFDIRVGDCTRQINTGDESEEIENVSAVPCSEPHDIEFYSNFNLTQSTFPGIDIIEETALETCLDAFEGFVGIPYEESALDITYMYPTAESWNRQNDREIICAVFHIDSEQLVGSAKGMKI